MTDRQIVLRDRKYLIAALVVQILFWVFSQPLPQLWPGLERSVLMGWISSLMAVLTLVLIPVVLIKSSGDTLDRFGLGKGDFQFGWKALTFFVPIFVIGTFIGSTDKQIQDFYPVPGHSIGHSLPWMLVWFGGYGLYYVSFEFFYRGFLLRGPQSLSLRTCFILQVVCCCLIHAGKPTAEVIASIPASIVFGGITIRARSIWYAVVLHYLVGIANDLGALWQTGELKIFGN